MKSSSGVRDWAAADAGTAVLVDATAAAEEAVVSSFWVQGPEDAAVAESNAASLGLSSERGS